MDAKWLVIPDYFNLHESVRIAEEYGAAFEYNDFFRPEVYGDADETEKRIQAYLSLPRDRKNDTLHGVFYDIMPISSDSTIRDRSVFLMRHSLSVARRLGVRGVVFHTGILSGLKLESYKNGWLNASAKLYRSLCADYPDLEIYLENTTEPSPELLVAIANELSDVKNFRLCLDYAHAALTETPACEWVRQMSPYIGHIHLNDNNGEEDLHSVPGTGNMDFGEFCALSEEYFKDTPVLLELYGNDRIKAALEYMKGVKPSSHNEKAFRYETQDLLEILDTTVAIAGERDKNGILNLILDKSMEIANCDAGTLYLLKNDALHFKIMKTKSMGVDRGSDGCEIDLPPVPLKLSNACAYAAISGRSINIEDVYKDSEFDFSGPKRYDGMTGYKTKSMLAIPITDQYSQVAGVMQLINAQDKFGNIIPFSPSIERIFAVLAAQVAITLQQVNYIEEIRTLIWSFTQALAEAIDRRTPYNGSHTRNVAKYCGMIADEMNADDGETEKFPPARREQLVLSAFLHDIGKMVIPTAVMNKATRFSDKFDRINDRLKYILLLEEIAYLKGENPDYENKAAALKHAADVVNRVNSCEFLTDDLKTEVLAVSDLTYTNDGVEVPVFTEEEKDIMLIRKGTLTEKERRVMESHVEMTKTILDNVSFNKDYEKAPLFAYQHHECINGSGYPNRISGDELAVESRILAVSDICDALMATDRPYKKAIPADRAFKILFSMADEGKLERKYICYLEKALSKERNA